MLFGLPQNKDEVASGAYAEDGIVQRAISGLSVVLFPRYGGDGRYMPL